MKTFLRKILLFSIFPLILLTGAWVLIAVVSAKINYRLSDVKEIYIGDSHIECAVNDSLLPNSINVATGSEFFYFSYYKLKKLVEVNRNIERVYLGFSYHSLSDYCEQFLDGKYSLAVSPKYFYLLPFKEQLRLIQWNIKKLSLFSKAVYATGHDYLDKKTTFVSSCGYANKFSYVAAADSSMDKRLRFQYHTGDKLNKFSDINLFYLDKIIFLLKTHNIDLVILNTPLHPYYKNRIPANYIDAYNEIVKRKNLKVMNFTELSLNDSCFIPDGDHVSVKGAYLVTKEILRMKQEQEILK